MLNQKITSNRKFAMHLTGRNVLLHCILAVFLLQSCQSGQEDTDKNVDTEEVVNNQRKLALVGPAGFSSSFSYYNTTPESPNGQMIAYLKYFSMPEKERYQPVTGEIWVCNSDLSNHRMVVSIKMNGVHNGSRLQWLNDSSFVYQDDSIRVVTIDGKQLIKPLSGTVGHNPYDGRFLYSSVDAGTGLYTIYDYDVFKQKIVKLGDVRDYVGIEDAFELDTIRPLKDRKILHLQYSPDGSKIAFRLDIGTKDEQYKHLISQNIDGSDVQYFGPKPMHFAWFDNESIMGHDNQIDDGMKNDKSGRRWTLTGEYVETISGVGNHLAASFDRQLFASESWYRQTPVILKAFRKGETEAFWQDTVSTDGRITWTLGNHVNPSFSRDNKRIYYHKYTADSLVQAYMVVLQD